MAALQAASDDSEMRSSQSAGLVDLTYVGPAGGVDAPEFDGTESTCTHEPVHRPALIYITSHVGLL